MASHLTALLAALCLVLLAAPAHGWWCNGHMLVAEIARRHLKPDVAERMEKIASAMKASGPFPMVPDFVQLACWSDDIKAEKLYSMGGWHYIDTPYNPQNVPIKKWPVEDKNVMTVLQDLAKTLTNDKLTPYVTNFALANLIHFYGDIHQPLHNVALFSPELPNGDDGGNGIYVILGSSNMTLHAVWDSMCQGPQVDPPRPLSSDAYKKLKSFADYLMSTYQFSDAQKAEIDPQVFSRESYEVAVMATYNGVSNGMTLSEAYLSRCQWFAETRVALGGYRLAAQLNELFGSA